MFARLRKLQFFKAVESCTGGYRRFSCQRVKKPILLKDPQEDDQAINNKHVDDGLSHIS